MLMLYAMIVVSTPQKIVRPTNDLSEGEELDTHIKMHMECKARGRQPTTEPKEVLAIQETGRVS
jgi:hypothetical protein